MPSCFKPAGYDPIADVPKYNVAPRYTPGSPALVRTAIALRIARDEEAAYAALISGLEGEDKRAQASRLGLSGIVEERWEFQGVQMYRDLITGETGSVLERDRRRKEVTAK